MFEVDPVIDNWSRFREGTLDTEASPSKMSKVEASKSIDMYGKQKIESTRGTVDPFPKNCRLKCI